MKTDNPVIDLCDESDNETREPPDTRESQSAPGPAHSNTAKRKAERGLGNPTDAATDSPSPDTEVSTTKLHPNKGFRSKRPRIAATEGLSDDLSIKRKSNLVGAADSTTERTASRQPLMILQTTSDPTDEKVVVTNNLMDSLLDPKLLFTRLPVRVCRSLTLLHVQQRDVWSCGYRNCQMVLSALLPLLPPSHTYNADRPREWMDAIDVPSLKQLQHCLEQAWAAGMDPKGCKHYRGRIAGTQAQIGSVEVATALSSCGLDATVVQFISVPESRTQLGPFCAAYMGRQNSIGTGSRELALGVLQDVNSSGLSASPQSERPDDLGSVGPCLPLYLQYQGHSVTVVGVEFDNHPTDTKVSNLLVFDPQQPGDYLDSALQKGHLTPLRRSVARFHSQDTQVVLCTPSERCSKGLSVVTAREDAVSLHRRKQHTS